jgi:hypothetical protein
VLMRKSYWSCENWLLLAERGADFVLHGRA